MVSKLLDRVFISQVKFEKCHKGIAVGTLDLFDGFKGLLLISCSKEYDAFTERELFDSLFADSSVCSSDNDNFTLHWAVNSAHTASKVLLGCNYARESGSSNDHTRAGSDESFDVV